MRAETIEQHPANASLIRHLARKARHSRVGIFDPLRRPEHYYYGSGSHPEVVARVWDQLGRTRPDGRCLVAGTPALAEPASGIVLASAFGTSYVVRVPLGAMEEATQLGYRSDHRFPRGEVIDLAGAVGADWVFGRWLDFEFDWLRAVAITSRLA